MSTLSNYRGITLYVGGAQGPRGLDGDSFSPDAVGSFDGRDAFDAEDAGFSYLANDTTPVPLLYFKDAATSGEWSVGVPFVGGGTGDVAGPATATDNAIALFDGTKGELLQNSPLTFVSATLSSSDSSLTLQANAGTSGKILLTSTAAGLLSPDSTDEMSVSNGTITLATNILDSGGSLTLTDAGLQLGGAGARVTTILNTAAGDSTSETAETALVTAGWVKTFGGGGGGSGTVTSVSMTVPTGLAVTGSPITAAGTLAVNLSAGYVIPTQSALDAKQATLVSGVNIKTINGNSILGSGNLSISAGSVEGTTVLSTGETGGSKFLREDGDGTCSWQPITGGGDALTSSPLSQFAATTSSQLAGVISDETGSGALVFAQSPTLVTPALGTPSSCTLTNCTGLQTAGLLDGSVTFSKIQDINGGSIIGRHAGGSGVSESILLGSGLEFNGATIRRSAFTGGDVTASAGSANLTIAPNAVTNAKAADMPARTVKVNLTGSSADPTDSPFAEVVAVLGVVGKRTAVVGDITADAPTGYDTIEVRGEDNVLIIPSGLTGFESGGYLLLDEPLKIGTKIINETAGALIAIDLGEAAYTGTAGIEAGQTAVVTDGTTSAWKFAVGHPATTTRTDGKPDAIAPITKNADFTISETERDAPILLTKTGTGQVITLPSTGISVGWTQTYCRATSQAISFAGAGMLLGNDIASVTENKWFGLICTATGTYRFI